MTSHLLRSGTTAQDGFDTVVTPELAGWTHSSLRVLALDAGQSRAIDTGGTEIVLVPFEGDYVVVVDGETYALRGRSSVFDGRTDALYVPRDSQLTVTAGSGGRVALPAALAATRPPVQFLAAEDVPLLIRGAERWTRRVQDFCNPAGGFVTDSLLAVEVLNPGGNWSGVPRHKHDTASEHESELEELYYFEAKDAPGGGPGFGYMRVSTSEAGEIDVTEEVRSGDVVLVPFGWHGPVTAPPEHDLYYLNVMAGPGEGRDWKITDHPDDGWVRERWATLGADPRAEDPRLT